ncbi:MULTISPECIES: RNase P modulator RnpM [Pontibacillus]|uniref:YlxR family protein n=1 Tax=Pontibacillus chungwhensis TaxID=265426 RepID=A0ABY8V5Y9_9BACI|nr:MULTISPECIES: YlxR family protein [Pontibacillus]MCD5322724.1 YlxR family protein [Pontibacillus sp. HN14]WIF99999.1 YlxR family protein [Pontibacillus chungwhensis]
MAKNKKTPLRKCVVTKEMLPKQQLIRVVRNKDGEVFIDETGKKNGRGAYLTKDAEVIQTAREKSILSHHLKTKVDQELYDQLLEMVQED